MGAYAKPEAILKKLKLVMPVEITVEDPLTRQPIVVSYDNLHELLVVDVENLPLEAQVVSSLYAEMGRLARAAGFEAARADGRYRTWRAKVQDELRDERKGKKAPTTKELEDHYRSHADYDEMSNAGKRWEAVAGFFEDLRWAFKMKGDMIGEQARLVAGHERIEGRVDFNSDVNERLSAYENLAAEASRAAAESGASEAMAALLAAAPPPTNPKPPKAPRALD